MKNIKMGLSLGVFIVIIAIGIGSLVGMKIVSFISIDHQVVKYVVYGIVYYISILVSIKIIGSLVKIVSMMKNNKSR